MPHCWCHWKELCPIIGPHCKELCPIIGAIGRNCTPLLCHWEELCPSLVPRNKLLPQGLEKKQRATSGPRATVWRPLVYGQAGSTKCPSISGSKQSPSLVSLGGIGPHPNETIIGPTVGAVGTVPRRWFPSEELCPSLISVKKILPPQRMGKKASKGPHPDPGPQSGDHWSMSRLVVLKSIHRSTSVEPTCLFFTGSPMASKATNSDHCILQVGKAPCRQNIKALWEGFPHQR